MRPQQGAIEVCAPEAGDRMHLPVLPTPLTSSEVRGVVSDAQDKEGDVLHSSNGSLVGWR